MRARQPTAPLRHDARPVAGLRQAAGAALLALALGLHAVPAAAQGAGTDVPLSGLTVDAAAPVEIEADRLQVDQQDGSARFSGNVLVVQGALRLACADLLVDYAPQTEGARGRIRKLTATGQVTLVTESEQAEAEEAVYEVEARRITLSGAVLLTQGESIMAGERLVVNLADGTGTMSGRVRTVFDPGGPAGGQK